MPALRLGMPPQIPETTLGQTQPLAAWSACNFATTGLSGLTQTAYLP
jgi:hypothetical protein